MKRRNFNKHEKKITGVMAVYLDECRGSTDILIRRFIKREEFAKRINKNMNYLILPEAHGKRPEEGDNRCPTYISGPQTRLIITSRAPLGLET